MNSNSTELDDTDFPMLTCGLIDAEVKRRANAYPRLVEALRGMVREHGAVDDVTVVASALLAEIGE